MSEGYLRRSGIEAELRSGNTVTYYTVGVSMRPLLRERQTVVVIAPVMPKKNDITLYLRYDGAYVLHRLLRNEGEYFYIRGDNTYAMEEVHRSAVLGTVTHIHRKGKVIDVNKNKAYRAYVLFWNLSYPIRRVVYKVVRFFIRGVRFIKRKVSK